MEDVAAWKFVGKPADALTDPAEIALEKLKDVLGGKAGFVDVTSSH